MTTFETPVEKITGENAENRVATSRGIKYSPSAAGAWIADEFREYCVNDVKTAWKLKEKNKQGVQVYKRDFKSLGIKVADSVSCFLLTAELPFSVDLVHRMCHDQLHENSPKWIESYRGGSRLEVLPGATPFDEVVVNHTHYKLPVISDRDFVYITFMKKFSAPNQRFPDRTQAPGVMYGSVSVAKADSAVVPCPKGCVRGEILKGFVVVQQHPNDPSKCSYWWTQMVDLKGSFPKGPVNSQVPKNMLAQVRFVYLYFFPHLRFATCCIWTSAFNLYF